MVISPLEDMFEKVNNITIDPMKASYEEEERVFLQEMEENDEDGPT